MKNFRSKVLAFVKSLPFGRVASYGQVASATGHPKAARQVGGILKSLKEGEKIPWWRVVNKHGFLSIKGNWRATKNLQRDLLLKEKVTVSEDFFLDIKKYNYRKGYDSGK